MRRMKQIVCVFLLLPSFSLAVDSKSDEGQNSPLKFQALSMEKFRNLILEIEQNSDEKTLENLKSTDRFAFFDSEDNCQVYWKETDSLSDCDEELEALIAQTRVEVEQIQDTPEEDTAVVFHSPAKVEVEQIQDTPEEGSPLWSSIQRVGNFLCSYSDFSVPILGAAFASLIAHGTERLFFAKAARSGPVTFVVTLGVFSGLGLGPAVARRYCPPSGPDIA